MSALHNFTSLNFLAVGAGAALGAWMRWLLGVFLNPLFVAVPLGTLAANLIGGYLVGIALGVFQALPALAPEWRLALATGFLGGLTTFSTFSAEIVTLLARGELVWGGAAILMHVGGSLAATAVGLALVGWLRTLG